MLNKAISMQRRREGMPILMSGVAMRGEALIAPEEVRTERAICG